jgi:hypothetical protein
MFYDQFYLLHLVQEKLLNNHDQQEILDNNVYLLHDLEKIFFCRNLSIEKENLILPAYVILICRNVDGPFKTQST